MCYTIQSFTIHIRSTPSAATVQLNWTIIVRFNRSSVCNHTILVCWFWLIAIDALACGPILCTDCLDSRPVDSIISLGRACVFSCYICDSQQIALEQQHKQRHQRFDAVVRTTNQLHVHRCPETASHLQRNGMNVRSLSRATSVCLWNNRYVTPFGIRRVVPIWMRIFAVSSAASTIMSHFMANNTNGRRTLKVSLSQLSRTTWKTHALYFALFGADCVTAHYDCMLCVSF